MRGLAAQIKELKRMRTKCESEKKKKKCTHKVDVKIGELKAKRYELSRSLIDFRYKERVKKDKESQA